jgi:hypothetical protein
VLDVYAYAGSVGPAAALGDRRYTCHPTFNHYLVSKIPRAEIRAFMEFLIDSLSLPLGFHQHRPTIIYEDCVTAHRAFEAHSSRHPIRRRRCLWRWWSGSDMGWWGI